MQRPGRGDGTFVGAEKGDGAGDGYGPPDFLVERHRPKDRVVAGMV